MAEEGEILYIGSLFEKLENYLCSGVYREQLKKEERLSKKLKEFLKLYPIENIQKLKKETYCLGLNNKESYCNWVEKILKYGEISGRTNAYQKFVLYYDSKRGKYIFGDKRTKNRKDFGSEEDEIFENVKKWIIKAVEDINSKDYASFAKNPLNPMVKNKIAFLYDSENQIPIYGENDLNIILTAFGVKFDYSEDRIYKRNRLFEFYKASGIDEKVSPYIFMSFIYSDIGYRSLLKNKTPALSKYKLVDVSIKNAVKNNTTKKFKSQSLWNRAMKRKRELLERRVSRSFGII